MSGSSKANVRKRAVTVEIQYPVLIECANIVSDSFWEQFYKDLASGKGSRGIYISNGIIQTTNKRSGFKYSIIGKTPEIIISELQKLFSRSTSLFSKKDTTKKKNIIKEIKQELDNADSSKWSSIKRKQIKFLHIVNYVIRLREKHNFPKKNLEYNYKVIINAFETKTHTSKDVVFEDGKIQYIVDIEMSDDKTHLVNNRSINEYEIGEVSEAKLMGYVLQKMFEGYIINWEKYVTAN